MLSDFEAPKETWDLHDFKDKIEYALQRKTDGNTFFTKGQTDMAAKKYKKALKVFSYDGNMSDEEKSKVKLEVRLLWYFVR